MNRIERDNYTTRLGNTKYISSPDKDGFICKFFKTKEQQLPIEEQRKIIELKKQYMGGYIPQTILCEIGNGEYFIKQKFIKGKTLAETDIGSLSADTLLKLVDLIKKYMKYHKEQGGEMDVTGYQYYKGDIGIIERKFRNFFKIHKNFLTSTNIMISEDGNVYMVDVCESNDSRLLGKIKNFCAKPFIKRTISQLEKALQKKMSLENKNEEIFQTLNN